MNAWITLCIVASLLQMGASSLKSSPTEGREYSVFKEIGKCLPAGSCFVATSAECKGEDSNGRTLMCCPWKKWTESTGVEKSNLPTKPGEIARKMCLKYNFATFTYLTPGAKPIRKSRYSGHWSLPRIVGGVRTRSGEFPHMAAVGVSVKERISYRCGGSLISPQFVLTAAHCTTSKHGLPKRVRLGAHNILDRNANNSTLELDVAEVIVHPDYKSPSIYNDIALLRMSESVVFSKYIAPACLYTKSNEEEIYRSAIATGWGKIGYEMGESEELQKVLLGIIERNLCQKFWTKIPSKFLIPQGIVSSLLCAGQLEGGKDTCQGDSGGPLQVISKDNHYIHIIGIISTGYKCAEKNAPGLYTRVSNYIDWIEKVVWPQT